LLRLLAWLLFPNEPEISVAGFFHNQVFVTLGNMVGGGVMTGMIYVFYIFWAAFPKMKNHNDENLRQLNKKKVDRSLFSLDKRSL
jgi:hypothetical protein